MCRRGGILRIGRVSSLSQVGVVDAGVEVAMEVVASVNV